MNEHPELGDSDNGDDDLYCGPVQTSLTYWEVKMRSTARRTMTVREVAKYLGIPSYRIWQAVVSGELDSIAMPGPLRVSHLDVSRLTDKLDEWERRVALEEVKAKYSTREVAAILGTSPYFVDIMFENKYGTKGLDSSSNGLAEKLFLCADTPKIPLWEVYELLHASVQAKQARKDSMAQNDFTGPYYFDIDDTNE